MPREPHLIGQFRGIITSVEADDVREGSYLWAQDLDCYSTLGLLQGRHNESTKSTTKGLGAKAHAVIQNDDSTVDIVFQNAPSEQFSIITDFYGGFVQTNLEAIPASKEAIMIPHNREVHIGTGNSSTDVPKWIGYTGFGRLGSPGGESSIIADAECAPADLIPQFHKVVTAADGSIIYGFEHGGNTLFKVTLASELVVRSLAGSFNSIQAMCYESDSFIWVYDKGVATDRIIRIDTSDLSADVTVGLAEYDIHPPASTFYPNPQITDMILTTNKLWWSLDSTGIFEQILFNIDIPLVDASDVAPDDRSPEAMLTDSQGAWYESVDGGSSFGRINAIVGSDSPKLNLVAFSGDRVGMMFGSIGHIFTFGETIWPYYRSGASTYHFVNACIVILAEDHTPRNVYPIIRITPGDTPYANVYGYDALLFDDAGDTLYTSRNTGMVALWDLIDPTDIPTEDAVGFFDLNVHAAGSSILGDVPMRISHLSTSKVWFIEQGGAEGHDIISSDADLDPLTVELAGSNIGVTVENATASAPAEFDEDKAFFYKTCIIYDTYQRSPLSQSFEKSPDADNGGIKTITISVKDPTVLSPRISAIEVYRASAITATAEEPDEFYRLIATADLISGGWTTNTDGSIEIDVEDTMESNVGPSFEAETGFSETLPSTIVHWQAACTMSGYHFVANCWHPELTDGSHFLFRSKAEQFDTFDWTRDFCRLPTVPTAIAAFAGKVWVFDENRCYRVNPDSLAIEDAIEGMGCMSIRSVCVTDYGMFVASKNNIYHHDGQRLIPIGRAISYAGAQGFGWKTLLHTLTPPIVTFSEEHMLLMIVVNPTGDTLGAFVYALDQERWEWWDLGEVATYVGLIKGTRGEVYVSDGVNQED